MGLSDLLANNTKQADANRNKIRHLYLAGTKDVIALCNKTGLSRVTVYSHLKNWDVYIVDHTYYRVCQDCGDRQQVSNKKNSTTTQCAKCARKALKHLPDPVTRTIIQTTEPETTGCVHHYILDTAGNGSCRLCGKKKYTAVS